LLGAGSYRRRRSATLHAYLHVKSPPRLCPAAIGTAISTFTNVYTRASAEILLSPAGNTERHASLLYHRKTEPQQEDQSRRKRKASFAQVHIEAETVFQPK